MRPSPATCSGSSAVPSQNGDLPLGGSAIDVLRHGNDRGPRLMCLPFAGGSTRSFEPLARHLPASWWIGVPRRPDAQATGPALEELAQRAARALRALATQPTVVMGHSMGAVVAHRAAQLLGDRWPSCAVLVLSAPPPLHSAAADAAGLAGTVPELLVRQVRRLGLLDGRYSDDVLTRLVLPTFRRDLATIATYRFSRAPLCTRPVVLAGTRDLQAPPDVVRRHCDGLGARDVYEIDGDHMFVVSRAADVASVLLHLPVSWEALGAAQTVTARR